MSFHPTYITFPSAVGQNPSILLFTSACSKSSCFLWIFIPHKKKVIPSFRPQKPYFPQKVTQKSPSVTFQHNLPGGCLLPHVVSPRWPLCHPPAPRRRYGCQPPPSRTPRIARKPRPVSFHRWGCHPRAAGNLTTKKTMGGMWKYKKVIWLEYEWNINKSVFWWNMTGILMGCYWNIHGILIEHWFMAPGNFIAMWLIATVGSWDFKTSWRRYFFE